MDNEFGEMMFQLALAQPLIISTGEADYTGVVDEISRRMSISESDMGIFDAASPIKELREMMSEFLVKPHSSAFRLFVIVNCENMSVASSNTLLKLLEEPPEYLRIVLFTSSYAKILPTIKSRCKRVSLAQDATVSAVENFYEFFKARSFRDFSKHIAKLENDELATRVKSTLEVMRQNGLNKAEGHLFKKLSDAYIKLSSQNINGKLKLEGIFIEYLAKDA
jgi:DNA polymerase III delta prime subunit